MRALPWGFIGGFSFIFVGYNTLSHVLQVAFYRQRAGTLGWKSQPGAPSSCGKEADESWSPVVRLIRGARSGHSASDRVAGTEDQRSGRAPDHDWVSLVNLVVGSSMAGLCFELCRTGRSRMVFSVADGGGLLGCAATTLGAVAYQLFVEYYWHRLMHLPWFYKRFHKMHHCYKAPRPFDDLYIHPLESFGYYCILYAPPFLFQIHALGFALYMATMGTAGVLDHSGVRAKVPLLYNTEDHDMHHQVHSPLPRSSATLPARGGGVST